MHCSLSHDFLNDYNLLLSGSSYLIKGLSIHYQTLISLFQYLTDFIGNKVCCSMSSQWSRTLHIGLLFNGNIGLNEDISLVRRSRTSPHNVLIKVSFGRSELTNLNTILIGSGNYHNNTVQYTSCSSSNLIITLFGCDRLNIHDSVGVGMILIRSNDINLQIHYKLLRIHTFLLNAFTNGKNGTL